MPLKNSDFNTIWAKIIARAWKEPAFKQKLLKDPKAVLKEYKIDLPAGTKAIVHANEKNTIHLTLPEMPSNVTATVSDEELRKIAAAIGPLQKGLVGGGDRGIGEF